MRSAPWATFSGSPLGRKVTGGEEGSGVPRGDEDSRLGRDDRFPGADGSAHFGLQEGKGGGGKDEVDPQATGGGQASGEAKRLLRETTFSRRTRLAKDGDSFHEGL